MKNPIATADPVIRSARRRLSLLLVLLVAPAIAFADSSSVKERTTTKIADGIYVIRHQDAPNGFPQGNTTVIIGDHDVLVVDSCYLPSSAREDIAQIRQWTDKPVRYLLNTHWHADHSRGNGTYADAFPSITIISQTATRGLIKGNYADHPENAVMIVRRGSDRLERWLKNGKTDDGNPLTDGDKAQIKAILAGIEVVAVEFKDLVPRLPDVTFDQEMNLDLGHREAQIKFLGRGNTAGDAIVYLPKERILVAGDLVVHPGPYSGSGYPSEWSKTLEKMVEMDPLIVVPGHGEILHGTSYLLQLNEYVEAVVTQVQEQYFRLANIATLDDIKKAMDMDALKQRFGGYFKDDAQNGEPYLDLDGLIKVAYEEIQPR